jgi:hypothetical protein
MCLSVFGGKRFNLASRLSQAFRRVDAARNEIQNARSGFDSSTSSLKILFYDIVIVI